MLRPSPNHGTQRLPNDDDDELAQSDLIWRSPDLVFACLEMESLFIPQLNIIVILCVAELCDCD